jgi:hypothetical protein
MKWFRACLLLLLFLTVLWGISFYSSLRAYGQYLKDYRDLCERIRRESTFHVDFSIPESYCEYGYGSTIVAFGFLLSFLWMIVLPTKLGRIRSIARNKLGIIGRATLSTLGVVFTFLTIGFALWCVISFAWYDRYTFSPYPYRYMTAPLFILAVICGVIAVFLYFCDRLMRKS